MKVAIIGCGGTGTNWCAAVKEKVLAPQVKSGDIEMLIIDGSDSNVRNMSHMQDVETWLCPGTDGAGMVRGRNAEKYLAYITGRLHELPEADMYIVAFSAIGGSGSVFGPEVALECLRNNKPTIVLSMLSTSSKSAAENSFNVVNGLDFYSKESGKPIVASLQNADKLDPAEVDANTIKTIEALVYGASSEHDALDTSDLNSFLDYTHHGIEATLTELVIAPDVEELRKDKGAYLTTLSLLPNLDAPKPNIDELSDLQALGGTVAMYLGTRIDRIPAMLQHVGERNEHYQKVVRSHSSAKTFATGGGMKY